MTDASLLKDLVDELLYAPFKKKNKNYTDNDLSSLIEQTFELSELCSKYQVVYSTCHLTLQKLSTLSLLSDISQEVKRLTAERGTHNCLVAWSRPRTLRSYTNAWVLRCTTL